MDKRYTQQVEKTLTSFDNLEEWADYISFLSRLSKSLQLANFKPHSLQEIPCSQSIANKLSLCLSPTLPNGVHMKVLGLYESILQALSVKGFNSCLSIWVPVVLPILSFGSIQVKSEVIKIFKVILDTIEPKQLKNVTRPLILSFLAGLDDENSESFPDAFQLLESLQRKLVDDNHFWQNMFVAIISNPERRIGGLAWCNKRLPVFIPIKKGIFSDEATACLTPNPGLLIRSFASSINTTTIFNQANDIIIIRGFFDLMLSHLPLNSEIFVKSYRDKKLLMRSCVEILLKKDMSLNRRLWNWLLGPDPENHDSNTSNTDIRSKYFQHFGLDTLLEVLMEMINSDIETQTNGFKVSLSLIIDKWEISHLLIPKLLSPILTTCYKTDAKLDKYHELLSSGQSFFNGVEATYIWSNLIGNLTVDQDLSLLEFVLSTFDFNDDDMKLHIPYGLIVSLSIDQLSETWLNILSMLIDLISPKTLGPLGEANAEVNDVLVFYTKLESEETKPPLSNEQVSYLVYKLFKKRLIEEMNNSKVSGRICDLFIRVVNLIPMESNEDDDMLGLLLGGGAIKTSNSLTNGASLFTNGETDGQINGQINGTVNEPYQDLIIGFNLCKLFAITPKNLSTINKSKIIKIITTKLYPSLISCNPNFHQAEAVKSLLDLDFNSSSYYIEAAITRLLLQSDPNQRSKALTTLWTNSSNESDGILMRPLQIVLDDLETGDSAHLGVSNFIKTVSNSGHCNRLLKMITNPLLDFKFLTIEVDKILINDELNTFSYHLTTIINVISTNTKTIREAFNNEFAVMDNSQKLAIIKANEWDISTYKSLIFYILEKFLSLKLDTSILTSQDVLQSYYKCVSRSLELFNMLITGNEPDFGDKFHNLIDYCSYLITLPSTPYEIELVETHYLKTIFQMLKLAEDLRINLHLHVDNQEPTLIHFIITGINKARSPILLEELMKLLTRSLYLFNESIFSVLPGLNSVIINRIEEYFGVLSFSKDSPRAIPKGGAVPGEGPELVPSDGQGPKEYLDVEPCINALISGIEDLLSISHSYLLTSKIRKADPKKPDSSFLGNVIQGVFSIESPALRTTEQNKLYAILQAFQDTIKTGFTIWEWCDSKKGSPSITNLGNKLKFRCKKLLESLMDLERQEIIEMFIEIDSVPFKTSIKLLHVLDGGRSQITIPHIFNSVLSRCYPNLLDASRKSHMHVGVNEQVISRFLIYYFQSIDNDTIIDIYAIVLQFFKDVLNHFNHFKLLVPNLLKIISIVSMKLTNRFDGKKHKKELGDMFMKLLTSSVNGKRILFNSDGITEKGSDGTTDKEKVDKGSDSEDESESESASPAGFQDELIDTISELLPSIDDIIQDHDKVNNCINLLIFNLISPQTKPLKVNDIPIRILTLLVKIGNINPNKSWKLLVNDIFQDPQFFLNLSSTKLSVWFQILRISYDAEKLLDLLNRLSTTPGNLFSWNEKSEVENGISSLKRVSLILLSHNQDHFLSCLDDIFKKLESNLNNPAYPLVFKTQIIIILRIILLRFNQLHLLPYWTMITQHLMIIFDSILNKTLKELTFMSEPELTLILNGCKLLDHLLLLRSDEFNLNEWLFINNKVHIDDVQEDCDSIIDKISRTFDLTVLKESPIKLNQSMDDQLLIPLLSGTSSIKSIGNLRTFFESLSVLNYERVYSLKGLDEVVCEDDIVDDLLS